MAVKLGPVRVIYLTFGVARRYLSPLKHVTIRYDEVHCVRRCKAG